MVNRGRTNPRIPTRHRHPHHRTCAVPQAPRRLPTHRGHARRHPPNPQTLQPFSTHHRIITVQGDVRDVVVIGERFHDNTGEVVGTQGFYLDVTPSAKQRQESISVALAEIADHRAAIEQAKGVLMYIYGIGPDAAFDILKWRSQDANIKLRARRATGSRHPHTQARRRLSAVAPDVRPAATHRPRTRQSPWCLSAPRGTL